MCCRTRKNNQIQQKLWENEENLAIFTVILMAAFGAKNVHSAPTVDVRHICVKGLSSHDLTCVYVGCFTAQLSKRAL